MKFSTYSFKQLLSGGLLCCLILLAAYIFQAFFPGMYVDAFSSSFASIDVVDSLCGGITVDIS